MFISGWDRKFLPQSDTIAGSCQCPSRADPPEPACCPKVGSDLNASLLGPVAGNQACQRDYEIKLGEDHKAVVDCCCHTHAVYKGNSIP